MKTFDMEAESFLNELLVKLEEFQELEVRLEEGVLTIKAENGDYAINKHSITSSIWYSSPVSSLKYFALKDGVFVDKKNHTLSLEAALFEDLNNKQI